MLNRKGHIGTYLLLFGALSLVVYSLVYMANFKNNFVNDEQELNLLMEEYVYRNDYIKEVLERIISESSTGVNSQASFVSNFKRIAERRDDKLGTFGNFFAKIRNDEFSLEKIGDNQYLLKIEGISFSVENEAGEISRTFDLNESFTLG